MTISSLRSQVRPDNLKSQVRSSQSWARRIYLGLLLIGVGWIAMQFVGPMMLLDANGLVAQEREVVMPSYPAQVVSVTVGPGDKVRKGQPVATVISSQMLDLISELTTKQAEARSRQEQIKAKIASISDTLPAADKRVADADEATRAVDRAKAGGFATTTRQAEVAQGRYMALREAAALRAEAAGLKSEQDALEQNLGRLTAALEKANQTYGDGTITASVDGTIGPQVIAAGTYISPGEHLAEIHHGEKYVVGYLTTQRLYSTNAGDKVVVTDGVNRQVGRIERLEAIADRVPAEFQSGFYGADRQQLVRIAIDDSGMFPVLAKIKVRDPRAPSNLLAEGQTYVASQLAGALGVTAAAAAPLVSSMHQFVSDMAWFSER